MDNKNIWLLCIRSEHSTGFITKGKLYKQLLNNEGASFVEIIDDSGNECCYYKLRFIEIKNLKLAELLYN